LRWCRSWRSGLRDGRSGFRDAGYGRWSGRCGHGRGSRIRLSGYGLRWYGRRRGRLCGGRARTRYLCFGSGDLERAGLLRSGCGAIDRDDVGIDVTYRAVCGLNPGEDKTIDEDGEAFPTRYGGQYIGGLPGLSEDLSGFWMVGAIYVADVVGPRCRSGKEKYT
jgi:hypothetical protein